MNTLMNVVRTSVAAIAGVGLGLCALADEVDVDSLLQESALWLDAAIPASFQRNASGGVTTWINQSVAGRATYGDAKAYYVNPKNKSNSHDTARSDILHGTVEFVHDAPAYQMGDSCSQVDLCYGTITGIRTVFLVGDFKVDDKLAPLLGDANNCNFHRGAKGEFAYPEDGRDDMKVWHNSATATVSPTRDKPTPGEMNFIILESAVEAQSDQMSHDRDAVGRNGGRALHEVIVFTRVLSDAERKAVYDYLYAKWHDGGWDKGQYSSYLTSVNGVTADWFALPWTKGGVSVDFPELEGVNEARLDVSGTSTVSFSKTVNSLMTRVVNADANAAQITFTGPAALEGSLDLENFNGSVSVRELNVGGSISLGAQSTFELYAAAGETWTGGVRQVIGGEIAKTGAGTVVQTGAPASTLDVREGVLGLLLAQNESAASLNVKSTTKTGVLEKRGGGTLTLAGASFADVQVKVLEGTLEVSKSAAKNTALIGITATSEKPFLIGPGATAVIDGNQASRLPPSAFVKIEGGTLVLRGVNALDGNYPPQIDVNNGVVEFNHYVANQHIKISNLTMRDSTLKLTGTQTAYSSQGVLMPSQANTITTSGECLFDQVEGNNKFASNYEVPLVVQDGTTTWNIPTTGSNVRKTGQGVLRFGPKAGDSETAFIIAEGAVANGVEGGKCAKLQLESGTVLKAADGDPLAVTTLTMPSTGKATLDLTGVDFEKRTLPLVVLQCATSTDELASKIDVVGHPGALWEISTAGGISVRPKSVAKDIVWNTGDGDWTATAWNSDPSGYVMDGFHRVAFADRASGDAGALVTVTIPENRSVTGFDLTAATTPYRLTGAGIVTMPQFAITGTAGYSIESPISPTLSGLSFAATTADQTVLDVRGTIGDVTIPPAAGGTVKLGFTNESCIDIGAISIGSGKTLELYNARSKSAGDSPRLNGQITGDETTLLKVTAGPDKPEIDNRADSVDFRGHVEVADGAILYIGSTASARYKLAFSSSPEKPFYIHGLGSTALFYAYQNNKRVMMDDAYIRVEDGGCLQLKGVNLQAQDKSPCVTVSNAFLQVLNSEGGHIHVRDVTLSDNGVLELMGTAKAFENQGLVIWGNIAGVEGESILRLATGNPNYLFFREPNGSLNGEGEIEVRDGARMVFDNARFKFALHKTGAGTLVLGDRPSVFGADAKTLKLDEGYLLANAKTETASDGLATVQVRDGVGFDLSERTSDSLPWTPAFALAAEDETVTTRVLVKLPEERLRTGTRVIKLTTSPADRLIFKDVAGKVQLVKKPDGVYVNRGFVLLVK